MKKIVIIAAMALFAIPGSADRAVGSPVVVDNYGEHKHQLELFSDKINVIHSAADRNDVKSLVHVISRIDGDSSYDIPVREHLVEAGVIAMSRIEPDAAAWQLISGLKNRSVVTYMRMSDEHGSVVVPLYDLAAAAAFTERVWRIADAEKQVGLDLEHGRWRIAGYFEPHKDYSLNAWQSGTARAFDGASIQSLLVHKSALIAALKQGLRVDDLVLLSALRLKDAELFNALANHGEDRVLLRAIGAAGSVLPANDLQVFLVASTQNTHALSAATLEIGMLALVSDDALSWLASQLGDQRAGSSAALALARISDDRVFDQVREAIVGNGSALTKLRAALVLRLSETETAAVMQKQLGSHPGVSPALKRALQ